MIVLLLWTYLPHLLFVLVFWGLPIYFVPTKRLVLGLNMLLQLLLILLAYTEVLHYLGWPIGNSTDNLLYNVEIMGLMLYHYAFCYAYFVCRYLPEKTKSV